MSDLSPIQLYEYCYDRLWIREPKWTFLQISDALSWDLNRNSSQKKYKRLCTKLKKEYKPKQWQSKEQKRRNKSASRKVDRESKVVPNQKKTIIDIASSREVIDNIPYGEITPTMFASDLEINDWIKEYIDFFDGDYESEEERLELSKEWILEYLMELATALWTIDEVLGLLPRGYGKTETTIAVFVRWFIEVQLPLYMVSPSSSHSSAIMDRIESHCYYWKIRRDYGDIFGKAYRSTGNMYIRYNDSVEALHKKNLKIDKPIMFVTFLGGKKGRHPARVHFEDVMQEEVVSSDTMLRIIHKLNSTYFKMFTRRRGRKTMFSLTGTRYAIKDIYQYMIDRRKLKVIHKRALEEDNKTMLECPNYTLNDLLEMKDIDEASFETEMNNHPVPSSGLYFKEHHWVSVEEAPYHTECVYYMVIDPARGMSEVADNTAIIIVAISSGIMTVVDGYVGRIDDDEKLLKIEQLHIKYNPAYTLLEVNYAQIDWRKFSHLRGFVPYNTKKNKMLRISAMKSYFKEGLIHVLVGIQPYDYLHNEYLQYNEEDSSATRKDDAIDALSILINEYGSYLNKYKVDSEYSEKENFDMSSFYK